jgi:ABC-type antimicrobial peptide transport system permease subunit
LLARILHEGALIAGVGIVTGVIGGAALSRFASAYIPDSRIPGVIPLAAAAILLVAAALAAALVPAARASRVDVTQALRSE